MFFPRQLSNNSNGRVFTTPDLGDNEGKNNMSLQKMGTYIYELERPWQNCMHLHWNVHQIDMKEEETLAKQGSMILCWLGHIGDTVCYAVCFLMNPTFFVSESI